VPAPPPSSDPLPLSEPPVTPDPAGRLIRSAGPADGAGCAAVYAPYVTGTAVTFELEPPDAAEMTARIAAAQRRHAWLVLEQDGEVRGYAYAGPFKAREAYRFACEASVYLAPPAQGSGAGRALYEVLFARLRQRGLRTVAAGMTLPNEASARLHHALGFVPVGTWRRVGWKLGAWHDVAWSQLDLYPSGGAPTELR